MLYLKNLWSARLLQALPGAFTRRMFIVNLQWSSGNCKPSPFSLEEFYESALHWVVEWALEKTLEKCSTVNKV